eukprot:CAMPEP_0196761430 /NCGR_PEP_ID=MMETSP1095-20130614/673_1 /TAXON_ID=96789 ORGANISM="Chromulina nebulosa, Strain UTEXLB2642" /NCGR_SAMPLE_ID=MMETSP1095 /ASSEMBLY_ACC=CAM_ASM_000446 /LENGTH=224 /DNA_ID=CAMNT_0042110985 /DNA_START=61 /DNA_END=735 /DNA_ORIENTATION=-
MSEFTVPQKSSEPDPEVTKEDEGDDGPAPEEESTAIFTPVVKLEAVEIKTFEEDEDILYKQRGKLYEYGETLLDKGTGNKQWKEKGVGEAKLLKHRESGRIRLLMRQEKTMKVIVNHFLDPRITINPHAGSDKAWVWGAFDFSDNELVEKTFAIRFGNPEIALEFKTAFNKYQIEMKKFIEGADSTEGTKEAEEISTAIESLSVKTEEKAEDSVNTEEVKKEAE